MPQQFLGNKEFLTKDIEVFASCPSNIALIKYWGKYEGQIPANPSISFTLSNCKTETKMIFKSGEKFSVKTFLAGKEETKFSDKIEKYFQNIEKYLPWILQGSFVIETENTFPHSSGIASSASGFGAIAKCLMEMDKAFSGKDFFDVKKASFLARLGSGSACRSVYDGLVVWGEVNKVEGSSDLYAVKYPNEEIHPIFRDFNDYVLLIHEGQKSVSSTVGHGLMNTNPYAERRFQEARENFVPMKVAAKRKTLTQNCQGWVRGEEKFSSVIKSRAAAPNIPTTAGRKPAKTSCTAEVFIYFISILLMSTIRINDGSTSAKVAVALPKTAIHVPNPALWAAV